MTPALLICITGGPGAGKSTLLEALRQRGYAGANEVSRPLIQEQVALGSDLVPWQNLAGFAEIALERMMAQHRQAHQRGGITFFDRGLPDLIAYLEMGGLPVPAAYYRSAAQHPYHVEVLLAPPWPAIYVNDAERWQTFAEAEALDLALRRTYQRLGYRLRDLPRAPVPQRVAFVQQWLTGGPAGPL
ncbi:MAG: AAA family ATPase [Hymenobacter sp.]